MRTWTFKLRSGVMFHEGFGEMTSEDVKYTVEQSFKPDAIGGSAYFFRNHLDKIETPDKSTVVMRFKSAQWMVPSLFSQYVGYQNVVPKKYVESVGEQKAAIHPIGTGPYRHVEGKQGDYHRFEAVPGHWRKAPVFKELRHPPHPRAGHSAVRRARGRDRHRPGLRRLPGAGAEGRPAHPRESQCRAVLGDHDGPDHAGPRGLLPDLPLGGRPANPKSLENARKVRQALNLAVNKKAIIGGLWKGKGSETPYSYYYYPFHKGYSTEWKVPPYDPERAKKLLAEAGLAGGFEVRVNPYVQLVAQDGPDVMEAVALDWEKIGIKVKRVPESTSSFGPKGRMRKTGKTFSVYGAPPFDEPVAGWERVLTAKSAFNLLLDGAYDADVEAAVREMDADKRARAHARPRPEALRRLPRRDARDEGASTWAVSKKVGTWQTLAYTVAETNYEYISPAG